MRVLVVNGFASGEDDQGLVGIVAAHLERRGRVVELVELEAEGFDTFMSAAERRAYHSADNLVTEEARRSAALLGSVDGLLFCYPLVHGSIPPRVKSWHERVFVPEVSFTFTRSGKVTGALGRVQRVGAIVSCVDEDPEPHHRNGPGRALLRLAWMSGPRRHRPSYVPIRPGEDPTARVAEGLERW